MFIDAYAALESLKNNLQGGNNGALSGIDIPAIQGAMDDFNRERGGIGAKLQQLTQQKTDYQRRIDELSVGISNVEDVDLAEAMVEYQLAETAYTAALNVASQGFGLSLMDFIRG
jgi:flagellar hook-associated protein 3 FlgL